MHARARPDDDPSRRLGRARPQGKDHDLAGAGRKFAEQLAEPFGPVDQRDRAARARHFESKADPVPESGLVLDMRRGAALVRRGPAPARLQVGRVGHDVIERPGEERGRGSRQVTGEDTDTLAEAVESGILGRQSRVSGVTLKPRDPTVSDPRGQTERGGAGPCPDIEHVLAGACRDGRGQQHGVDGGAVAGRGLAQAHDPAEQGVLAGTWAGGVRVRHGRCVRPP